MLFSVVWLFGNTLHFHGQEVAFRTKISISSLSCWLNLQREKQWSYWFETEPWLPANLRLITEISRRPRGLASPRINLLLLLLLLLLWILHELLLLLLGATEWMLSQRGCGQVCRSFIWGRHVGEHRQSVWKIGRRGRSICRRNQLKRYQKCLMILALKQTLKTYRESGCVLWNGGLLEIDAQGSLQAQLKIKWLLTWNVTGFTLTSVVLSKFQVSF